MKRVSLAAVVFALALTAPCANGQPVAELDGTYQAVALTRDGNEQPADFVKTVSLKIAAGELTFTIKDKTFPAKIKVDAKAKPPAIDIAPSDGPEKGRTFPGIYKFENGELWLAFTEKGDRPTQFKGEGNVVLVRLKRDETKK